MATRGHLLAVGVSTATMGTGSITVGSALDAAHITPAQAPGYADGVTYSYKISEGSDVEFGTCVGSSSGTVFSRTVRLSKIGGSVSTSVKIDLAGAGQFRIIIMDDDFADYLEAVNLDTDGTLAANSDTKIPSQKAVKTYADALLAAADAMIYKGATDCSGNPNYPAANRGDTYRVSVAGKIGGASGVSVEAGDFYICNTDSTASGNQATVGSSWNVIQTNLATLAAIATSGSASDLSTGTLPSARLATADKPYGKQDIFIPAAAMKSRTTNGAAANSLEMTTNKNMFVTLDFDASTQEFAQFMWRMPPSWNEGTITFSPIWSHPSTATNFGVVFQLAAVACSNDDAGDVAFGTAQTSTDTGGTTNDIYEGPESSAITVAGSPVAGDYVMFQIARVPADGSDTMAVDARLHGIMLRITTDAGNDA